MVAAMRSKIAANAHLGRLDEVRAELAECSPSTSTGNQRGSLGKGRSDFRDLAMCSRLSSA